MADIGPVTSNSPPSTSSPTTTTATTAGTTQNTLAALQQYLFPYYHSTFGGFSSSWPQLSTTSTTGAQVPLSNYSSLNGATTSTTSPPRQPMAIDPALTNLNGSALNGQTRSYYPLPSHNNTSFLLSQFYQQHQQQQQQPQGTLSPQALQLLSPTFSTPSTSTSSLQPTAQDRKDQLLTSLKPLLDPKAFTGAQAVASLAQQLESFGIQDVEQSTRLMILSKMRDHAPNHYFRAWTENPGAMDILRDWLKTAVANKNETIEIIMPLLHIIDRLPLTVETLKTAKLGKLILKLVKDPPTPAIKDMASKVERKWRRLLEGAKGTPIEIEEIEDSRSKKRKEAPTKVSGLSAPPTKKPAVGSVKPLASSATKKKEVVKPVVQPAQEVKTDSSFFSTTKKKLPSFTKKPPAPPPATVKKETETTNIAQPSSIDPFQEALRSMGKLRKESPVPTPSSSATPPQVGTASLTGLTKSGKKKKTVSWASPDKLESIKLIEKAIYDDDDPVDGGHFAHSLRDLDRGEGAALHAHLFEETVDWSEPLLVEIPEDVESRPRGENSEEKVTQEQREQTALNALYMTPAQIPDTPAEASYTLTEVDVDKDVQHMILGPEVDSIFWSDPPPQPPPNQIQPIPTPTPTMGMPPSVSDLISQLGSTPVESSAALATLQALPPEQIQSLLQEVSAMTQGQLPQPQQQQPPFGHDPTWQPQNQNQFAFDYGSYHDDNNVDRAGWGGRGRGGAVRGGPPGGGRGGGAFRQFRRKPCSFFQAGRCKYGDQCDFAHDAA